MKKQIQVTSQIEIDIVKNILLENEYKISYDCAVENILCKQCNYIVIHQDVKECGFCYWDKVLETITLNDFLSLFPKKTKIQGESKSKNTLVELVEEYLHKEIQQVNDHTFDFYNYKFDEAGAYSGYDVREFKIGTMQCFFFRVSVNKWMLGCKQRHQWSRYNGQFLIINHLPTYVSHRDLRRLVDPKNGGVSNLEKGWK